MTRYFLFLGILFATISCQKDDAAPKEYEVVTQGVGGDCRLPLINFVDSQQQKEVEQLVGPSIGSYYGLNLPTTLANGTTLYVTIRKVKADESRVCTTWLPSYNAVFVTTYRVK